MTDKIVFIQYPKCSTCIKAKKWLIENGVEFVDRHIVDNNPNKEELTAWIDRSTLPINKFFNTSGKIYKENNIKDNVKTASKEELIELLASNGMLVKRPMLISESFVTVGFNEEEWTKLLK